MCVLDYKAIFYKLPPYDLKRASSQGKAPPADYSLEINESSEQVEEIDNNGSVKLLGQASVFHRKRLSKSTNEEAK